MSFDVQVASERVQKEWNLLNERSQKLHRDLEDQMKVNQQLAAQNAQRQAELRLKDEQIAELKVYLSFEATCPGLSISPSPPPLPPGPAPHCP